jgi:hypothetical protein
MQHQSIQYMAVAGDDDDDSLFMIRITLGYEELKRLYRSRCD